MIEGLRPTPPLTLPHEVAQAVEARRARVFGRVAGIPRDRRLELDDPDDLAVPVAACNGAADLPTFEAAVSIVALPRFADVDAVARALRGLLVPGGIVHLVEPVRHVGTTARLRATWSSTNPVVRGFHLERDIPLAFRSNDLLITDLERINMPTRTWPLRRFIDARARREAPLGTLPGDADQAGLEEVDA